MLLVLKALTHQFFLPTNNITVLPLVYNSTFTSQEPRRPKPHNRGREHEDKEMDEGSDSLWLCLASRNPFLREWCFSWCPRNPRWSKRPLDADGVFKVVLQVAHERAKTTRPNLLQPGFHLYHLCLLRAT